MTYFWYGRVLGLVLAVHIYYKVDGVLTSEKRRERNGLEVHLLLLMNSSNSRNWPIHHLDELRPAIGVSRNVTIQNVRHLEIMTKS